MWRSTKILTTALWLGLKGLEGETCRYKGHLGEKLAVDEEPITYSSYRHTKPYNVKEADHKQALKVQEIMRRKYLIGDKVELYYKADWESDPWFSCTIVIC